MPKPTLTATTTATATVKLSPQARQMLVQRLDEHQRLGAQVAAIKGTKKHPGRMRRIEEEVADIFRKEKQGKALADGTELDGHKMKLTIGKRKAFDQMGFMKKHGLTQADFDEFTEEKDNEPFIKFSHPGESDDADC